MSSGSAFKFPQSVIKASAEPRHATVLDTAAESFDPTSTSKQDRLSRIKKFFSSRLTSLSCAYSKTINPKQQLEPQLLGASAMDSVTETKRFDQQRENLSNWRDESDDNKISEEQTTAVQAFLQTLDKKRMETTRESGTLRTPIPNMGRTQFSWLKLASMDINKNRKNSEQYEEYEDLEIQYESLKETYKTLKERAETETLKNLHEKREEKYETLEINVKALKDRLLVPLPTYEQPAFGPTSSSISTFPATYIPTREERMTQRKAKNMERRQRMIREIKERELEEMRSQGFVSRCLSPFPPGYLEDLYELS